MACMQNNYRREGNANRYATSEDFCRVFSEELEGLYQLAFLLTGDHEKAERCFVTGLEDCYRANHVLRDWALSWAKRTIIRNSIREMQPRTRRDSSSSAEPVLRHFGKTPNPCGGRFETEAVLALEDLERFAFVISVLERYPDRDCAVLLGYSFLEFRQMRTRAILRVANFAQTASRPCGEEGAAVIGSPDAAVAGIRGNALFSRSSPHPSPEPKWLQTGINT